MRLLHIACIYRPRHNGVKQTRLSCRVIVLLHAEGPLVAFLVMLHFGVARTIVVPGRAGRRNQRGIYDRTGLEQGFRS